MLAMRRLNYNPEPSGKPPKKIRALGKSVSGVPWWQTEAEEGYDQSYPDDFEVSGEKGRRPYQPPPKPIEPIEELPPVEAPEEMPPPGFRPIVPPDLPEYEPMPPEEEPEFEPPLIPRPKPKPYPPPVEEPRYEPPPMKPKPKPYPPKKPVPKPYPPVKPIPCPPPMMPMPGPEPVPPVMPMPPGGFVPCPEPFPPFRPVPGPAHGPEAHEMELCFLKEDLAGVAMKVKTYMEMADELKGEPGDFFLGVAKDKAEQFKMIMGMLGHLDPILAEEMEGSEMEHMMELAERYCCYQPGYRRDRAYYAGEKAPKKEEGYRPPVYPRPPYPSPLPPRMGYSPARYRDYLTKAVEMETENICDYEEQLSQTANCDVQNLLDILIRQDKKLLVQLCKRLMPLHPES